MAEIQRKFSADSVESEISNCIMRKVGGGGGGYFNPLETSNVKSLFMRIHCKSRIMECWGRICCTHNFNPHLPPPPTNLSFYVQGWKTNAASVERAAI